MHNNKLLEDFKRIFGNDIFSKDYDFEKYKGYGYVRVINETVYVIEVSFESFESVSLYCFENVSYDNLLNEIINNSDNFYLIGNIYVECRSIPQDSERVKRAIPIIYKEECEWVLKTKFKNQSSTYNLEYDNGKYRLGDYIDTKLVNSKL